MFAHEPVSHLRSGDHVIRLLISAVLHLAANAVGLLIADLVLDDMNVEWEAFIVAVAFFTLVEVILGPLITKMALTSAPAFLGGIALVTTLVGLIITDIIFDGFSIEGVGTWLAATLIVWLGGLIAALILPLIFLRKATDNDDRAAAARSGTWTP